MNLYEQLYIRSNHPYAFKSGQWGKVVGTIIGWPTNAGENFFRWRPVFYIQFQDGDVDHWPIHDVTAGYEFAVEVSDDNGTLLTESVWQLTQTTQKESNEPESA